MSVKIIDHALKSSERTVRVIIVRYGEDCPRSERPRIRSAHPGRALASDILLVECSNASHSTSIFHFVGFYVIKSTCALFKYSYFFIPGT